MGFINISCTGLREIEAKLQAKIKQMEHGAAGGLERGATLVFHEAVDRAPVIEGKLQRSGEMQMIGGASGGATAEIKFTAARKRTTRSKGDFHYAAFAHEYESGQSPGYLENPLRENEAEILRLIATGAKVGG